MMRQVCHTHDAFPAVSSSLSGFRPGEAEDEGDGRYCPVTFMNESRTRARALLSGEGVPAGASNHVSNPVAPNSQRGTYRTSRTKRRS